MSIVLDVHDIWNSLDAFGIVMAIGQLDDKIQRNHQRQVEIDEFILKEFQAIAGAVNEQR